MFKRVLMVAALGTMGALFTAGCGSSGSTTESGGDNQTTPTIANAADNNTGNSSTGNTAGGPSDITIAVIPKGTTHAYWKSVQAGAQRAADELGVHINYKGPLRENDRASQIQIVEQFTSENISGIVLAPLDNVALRRPVQAAMSRNIPVVIIDSALQGSAPHDFVSYVSTDNLKGGKLGGERLAQLLHGHGKVVLLRYEEGSASTMDREAGFMQAMAENPGIQVIVQNRYGGATSGEAKAAALDLMDKLRQADGVFCPNESTTLGMLLALRQGNLAGHIKFVGFDTSDPLLDGLRAGQINALVAQNPTKMGYDGVQFIVAKLRGRTVAPREDTGVQLIDSANLNTTAIQDLLRSPDAPAAAPASGTPAASATAGGMAPAAGAPAPAGAATPATP